MKGTSLHGLEGTNPLGFLATLGIQVAFGSESRRPRLWWSDDVTPHAMVDARYSLDAIADHALSVFEAWRESPALNPVDEMGQPLHKGDEMKLRPDDIRVYLKTVRGDPGAALAAALVAEGSLDKSGVNAKPSDLYFTAGQMRFLGMARQILHGTTKKDLLVGLQGPWTYGSKLPSLMWDVTDDRLYALRAYDPTSSKEKKLSNPGAEALALLGMSRHPAFATHGRTITQGCSGTWKDGCYSWPLWRKPASPEVVTSLLAHAYVEKNDEHMERRAWFRAWGVAMVLRSAIRRSSQGGYGTFAPPEVAWRDHVDAAEL